MTTPDPQPETTTGLEPGGGLPPGEMPPAESSISGVTHQEAPPGRSLTRVALVALAVLILLVVAGVVIGAVQML